MSWIYDIPTIVSYLLFIIVIPLFAMLGLFIIKRAGLSRKLVCEGNNALIGVFLSLTSVFLGIMVSFLIVTVWGIYTNAQLNSEKEAENLFILYKTVSTLPDTEYIQDLIVDYLEYIINVEYEQLSNGTVSLTGAELLGELQTEVYNYVPEGAQENTLYSQSITIINQAIDYRIERIHNATAGIYSLIWWVAIIDAILIIMITWFLVCESLFHYVLVAIVSLYVASGIFVILILSYPFKGYAGLEPTPFELTLAAILFQMKNSHSKQ